MGPCLLASSSTRRRLPWIVCHICQPARAFTTSTPVLAKGGTPAWDFDKIITQVQESSASKNHGDRTVENERGNQWAPEHRPHSHSTKSTKFRPLLRPPRNSSPTDSDRPFPFRPSQPIPPKEKPPRGPWQPTKKLTFSAMAGLRTLYALDPVKFSKAVLSLKFGISREAVSRIIKSNYRDKERGVAESLDELKNDVDRAGAMGFNRPTLRGTKWDRDPATSARVSPVPAIIRAYEQSRARRK